MCLWGGRGGRTERELEKDFKFLSVREEYEKKKSGDSVTVCSNISEMAGNAVLVSVCL